MDLESLLRQYWMVGVGLLALLALFCICTVCLCCRRSRSPSASSPASPLADVQILDLESVPQESREDALQAIKAARERLKATKGPKKSGKGKGKLIKGQFGNLNDWELGKLIKGKLGKWAATDPDSLSEAARNSPSEAASNSPSEAARNSANPTGPDFQALYTRAARCILDRSTWTPGSRPDVDLDLHMFRKRDALGLLEVLLREARLSHRARVTVDTGRGAHSAGGRAVLQPAVSAFLRERGVHWRHGRNEGFFRIFLDATPIDIDPIEV